MELFHRHWHSPTVLSNSFRFASLLLVAVSQPLCIAQDPKPSGAEASAGLPDGKPRVLTVGTHARLTLPREAKRLAVGDPTVMSVELLNTREALVLGKSLGTTTVLAWYADGSYEPLFFQVQRDLSLLKEAVASICSTVRVQMAPDRDAVVITG